MLAVGVVYVALITHARARLCPAERRPASMKQQEMSRPRQFQRAAFNGGNHEACNPVLALSHAPICLARHVEHEFAAELNPAAVTYKLPDQNSVESGLMPRRPKAPSWLAIRPSPVSMPSYQMDQGHLSAGRISIPTTVHCRAAGYLVGSTGPKFDPRQHHPDAKRGVSVTHLGKQVHWMAPRTRRRSDDHGEGPATPRPRKRNRPRSPHAGRMRPDALPRGPAQSARSRVRS